MKKSVSAKFKEIRFLIYEKYVIQVLYIFIISGLVSLAIEIKGNSRFIVVLIFTMLYMGKEAILRGKEKHPKIMLWLCTVIILILIITILINRYEVINYYLNVEESIINNKLEFLQFLPVVVWLLVLYISLYETIDGKMYQFILPLICSILFLILKYIGLERECKYSLIAFIFIFFIDIFSYWYEKNMLHSIKHKISFEVSKKQVIKYGVIIASIMIGFDILASIIFGTKSVDEIRLQRFQSKINNIRDAKFSFSKDMLGGPIELSDKVIFKVKGDVPDYFRGDVKKCYYGTCWGNDVQYYYSKSKDPIERKDGYRLQLGESEEKKLKLSEMEITPVNVPWKTLFVPNNIFDITLKKGDLTYDTDFCFTNLSGINKFPYKIQYYKSYSGIEEITSGDKNILNYDVNSEDIKEYYKDYLSLPGNISGRVRALTEDIIKDCKNNTEKVVAIKNYLSSHYPYSQDVGEIPEGKEFVDYFLFQEKKGYCTYFATSCAVMLRIAGIPSRYVEGYKVDRNNASNGYYNVLEKDSHAFVEVLVSPSCDLWSIVESTPGYNNIGAEKEESNYVTPSYYHEQTVGSNKYINDSKVTEANKTSSIDIEKTEVAQKGQLNTRLLYILIILALSAGIGYLIYVIIVDNLKRIRFIRKAKITPFYIYERKRLNTINYLNNICESDMEQIVDIEELQLRTCVEKLIDSYYGEFYGDEEVTVDKASIYRTVEHYIREKQGFIVYWWVRFIGIQH